MLAGDARLAAACWAVAAWLMNGMDMGVATRPGSFGFFAAAWVTMMAAMMLPGAAPAIARHARLRGRPCRAAVHRHLPGHLGTRGRRGVRARPAARVAGRRRGGDRGGRLRAHAGQAALPPRCREEAGSGLGFGLCCVGSTIGLMAMLVALDVMSLPGWRSSPSRLAQKLLPAKAAIDVPLALAIVGLGLVIIYRARASSGAHARHDVTTRDTREGDRQ